MLSLFKPSSKIIRLTFVSKVNYHVHKDLITVSNSAINKIKEIINNNNKIEDTGLKLSAKKKDCGSHVYAFQPVNKLNERIRMDTKYTRDGVTIFIDNKSFSSIEGSNIDYAEDGIFSAFIFKNPNSTHKCDCKERLNI